VLPLLAVREPVTVLTSSVVDRPPVCPRADNIDILRVAYDSKDRDRENDECNIFSHKKFS
jgi:hypothetical protein